MSDTAILALGIFAALCGFLVGFTVGERRGRDAQWCDDQIETWLRDKQRRDKQGRFKQQERAT